MKKTLSLVALLFVLALPATLHAQSSDPCVAPVGSDQIIVGQKPVLTWTMDPSKTVVGFFVTVSGGVMAETDIGKPASIKTCSNGFLAYQYNVTTAPAAGSYTWTVTPWNNLIGGGVQRGTPANRPFDVVNQTASPGAATNLKTAGQ